jgi:class 3 adenylate cyclase/tetratricopeptide (TPR) repeat protein
MIVCPNCREENPPKFRLCGYCGTPLQAAAPAPPPREVRRTVTLLFCDLKGSTALGERLDSEALHEVKERYFAAMAAEIARHGGKIEKYIGDAIMAVFGLPHVHEDDAVRALRAAVGMQSALRGVNEALTERYGVVLANRIGVNTGEVVANDDPRADQKLVTGDAVNLAARLEQAAPDDQILIGPQTYHLVRDAVEVEAVEPLSLKGKSEPVPAWRLVSATGIDGYVRRHDAPLVGRDAELAALDRVLAEVREQQAVRLVTLIGDAGIGKSRLAYEAVARAGANARVLRGRCLPYGDGITFWPLREMASQAANIRFDDPTDVAMAKLAAALGDADVAARVAAAAGLSAAVFPMLELTWGARKFLERFAAGQPLVALVDDIHWAEPAFLDLLLHVLDHARDVPILLLATARHELIEEQPQWGERDGALRLVLKPLADDAAARVAANLLGAGLPEDIVSRIVAAAEGNPLYLEQMLSMLVDAGTLRRDGDGWVRGGGGDDVAVPPTIKALIEARLGRLQRDERTVIEPAAVIGLEFAAPAVASLAPESVRDHTERHLVALERKRFVREAPSSQAGSAYRFHHQLVRDTVYGGLLKRARATLHVAFVRWADRVNAERGRGLEFQEILGYHLEQAWGYLRELGPLDTAGREIGGDAARRLTAAARRSFGRGDVRAALGQYRRALALLADEPKLRLPLLPELAEVLLESGEFDAARSTLAEAQAEAERTVELTERLIPALELEDSHAELAKAWRLVALARQMAGQFGTAGDAIQQLIEHAQHAGDERLLARSALGLTYCLLYGPTPVPEAIEQCEALLAKGIVDRQVRGQVLGKLAQLQAMRRDFDAARATYRQGRSLLEDLGHGVHVASSSLDIAVVELLAGDAAAAERELRPDYRELESMGENFYLSTMASMLARAVLAQGRDDEALELTRTAESIAAEDDVDAQVLWRCARAAVVARGGALDEAETLASEAFVQAGQTEVAALRAEALVSLAAVLGQRGREAEASDALREARKLYVAKGDLASLQRLD